MKTNVHHLFSVRNMFFLVPKTVAGIRLKCPGSNVTVSSGASLGAELANRVRELRRPLRPTAAFSLSCTFYWTSWWSAASKQGLGSIARDPQCWNQMSRIRLCFAAIYSAAIHGLAGRLNERARPGRDLHVATCAADVMRSASLRVRRAGARLSRRLPGRQCLDGRRSALASRRLWPRGRLRRGGGGGGYYGGGGGRGYYRAPRRGDYGPQTNRGQDCYNVYGRRICCPKGWTVQDGRCAPYRGY